jgi:HD-GYP domain-containing protein (c-di-GMP phosphodiesterase class II)
MLKAINADSRLCICALQHHERYDGSGYPRGLDSDEIDSFASIIAIADVYDAMTASRAYRAPKCAFQVIAAFEDDGVKKYNPKYILTFLERIANLYQNAEVVLSDGRIARVVYINTSRLSKPVVEDSEKNMVDLSRTPGLTITKIL